MIVLVSEKATVYEEYKRLTGGNVLQMPFTSRKVMNRVQKLLGCREGLVFRAGRLGLNLETRCVFWADKVYRLTPKQAKLLEVFMRHKGRTLTRKYLMEKVWDTDFVEDTRTLDVHVRWLRERIEDQPGSPVYLRTVRGIGYRFGLPEEDEL